MKNYDNIIAKYLMEGELAQKIAIVPKELIPMRDAMLDTLIKLEAILSDEKKVLLDKYYDCMNNYRDAMEQHHFSEGFKAGILFGLEVKDLSKIPVGIE